jgi:hypothetical protein
MMSAYKSAEEEKTINYDPSRLRDFKPKVAQGTWSP